ncbi:hypothetical protein PFICI_03724 [Pestalotiopsis fici W106-1]|uniref:Heterokaryon incompatibility domain-containing protein n=1 Tax=Pestalotiopsis fici (strain W106-1 / CGMCC3.15140) TaxID=1229662 RepID=W3XI69_PESFW|nr:uncharacterized protein PFICI_03724 [Pestalotiopsis fici W106-1]ETS85699.1 hypothetical protein PFICI_03724 [Pestalotiopsis fici W106-1]
MESPVAYTYSPLEFSDSIRLLLLEPSNDNNELLRGSLVTRTLSSIQDDLHTYYTALSYVWGHQTRTEALELVDESKLCRFQLNLNTNLHSALTNVRDKSRAIFIWADAICIDQNNLDERGHQVGIMGNIYREAACTVIYLGPPSPDINYAFNAIHRKLGTSPKRRALSQKNTAQEADLNLDVDVLNDAFETLCSRDWFVRGWVFQELVLSNNARIQCGQHRVGWNDLHTMIQHLQCSRTSVSRFLDMDKACNDHEGRTFSQLVISRKGAQLSDPRDFFFCLMGIASDAKAVQERLPIDYSLDTRDVFVRAAKYLVGTMDLSSVVKHVNSDTGDCGLPSFVPTWGISELRTMSAQKDPLPAGPLWGERNVTRDCQIVPVRQQHVNHIVALGDVIPRCNEFVDALRESLERLVNHTQPSAGSPLQDLWDYWAESKEDLMLEDLWAGFCGALLGRDAVDIAPDYNENYRLVKIRPGTEKFGLMDIGHMIRLVEQNLSFSRNQDHSIPRSRLALSTWKFCAMEMITYIPLALGLLSALQNKNWWQERNPSCLIMFIKG